MQTTVTSTSWVDLGPAPISVAPIQDGDVYLYQGSASPSSYLLGVRIGPSPQAAAPSTAFYGSAHVFAIAPPGAAFAVFLEVDEIVPPPSSGGGAVAIADGADVAQGTTTDAAWSGSGAATIVAVLKAVWTKLGSIATALGALNQPVGSGSIATSQAPIGTTAASIVAARTGAIGAGRIAATLYNAGSATVYIGGSDVTTSTGMPLPAGASVTLDTTAAIYGIAASGTQTIGVTETY